METTNIILLGESGVGKTALLNRFETDEFRICSVTKEPTSHCKNISLENKEVTLRIVDTAGSERYRHNELDQSEHHTILSNYYKETEGVLLVYDVTHPDSFYKLASWLEELRKINENIEVLVVGNKNEDPQKIADNIADLRKFAKGWNLDHMEASAKSGENVEEVFLHLAKKILVRKGVLVPDSLKKVSTFPLLSQKSDPVVKQRNNVRISKGHSSCCNQKLVIVTSMCAVILSIAYISYQHYTENVVITPLNQPKMVTESDLDVPSMFWGSYMPGSYFGLRTRSPETLTAGMMWFSQKATLNMIDIRHWCEQWNGVKQFTWLQHDGANFGVQKIEDKEVSITTSFVKNVGCKHGGDWTAKIKFEPQTYSDNKSIGAPMSLMFYIHVPSDADLQPLVINEGHLQKISGYMDYLGNFTLHFNELEQSKTILRYNYLAAEAHDFAHLKEILLKHHNYFQIKQRANLPIFGLIGQAAALTRNSYRSYKANFIVYQATFIPPFELEIYFESASFTDRPMKVTGPLFDLVLDLHIRNFEEKFENVFKLQQKDFSVAHIKAAKAALSNMVGGIGYFYGSSLVQSRYNKEPRNYWNASLFTAVPARSFFPRGFLWDEGFHNLLILEWNPQLTKDIISHWLDLMNMDGWIPREQILGPEAIKRVPKEFVVQNDTNGNPPTFFLAFETLLNKMKKGEISNDINFLKRAFPRLKVWFEWFNTTQHGSIPWTYRWRGRDSQPVNELNPKTLASGLNDYPRPTHPTIYERHVDLRCWLTLAAGVLADIGEYIGEPVRNYRNAYRLLKDNKLLDSLHWSPKSKSYSDYGFHSTKVELIKKQIPTVATGNIPAILTATVRVVHEVPVLRFVDNFGYVSLFPFLLKVIDPDNPRLIQILNDLKDPKLLWTNYGLRSLSKTSSYYLKYNTEHDPPYWRGSIWINMNYLAVRALHYYSNIEGPHQGQARTLYTDLRKNIINTILNEYDRTGFLWEQYDDKNGKGKGAHPFTGWTALFVLLMAEKY